MKPNPTPRASFQQIVQQSIGGIITATLSEAGHAAVVRLTTACAYLEADTNIAYNEIKKALDAVNFRQLSDEFLKRYDITTKRHREALLAAFQIEKRNQLRYWKEFDSMIHETANLPAAQVTDLTQIAPVSEIAGVYNEPELTTDVNAQLVILIQLWCPEMKPENKRAFAKQIERTLEVQRKLMGN